MPTLDIETIELIEGGHDPERGFCLLEAVAYVAGEEWSDMPTCVPPSIAAFGRHLNDALSESRRQALKRFIEPMVHMGNDPALEDTRIFAILDWSIRGALAPLLRLVGANGYADQVLADSIVDATSLMRMETIVKAIAFDFRIERAAEIEVLDLKEQCATEAVLGSLDWATGDLYIASYGWVSSYHQAVLGVMNRIFLTDDGDETRLQKAVDDINTSAIEFFGSMVAT